MNRGDRCRSCGRPWSGRFHGAHAPHPGRMLQAECIGCGTLTIYDCEKCGSTKFEIRAKRCVNASTQMRFTCTACYSPPSFIVSLPQTQKRNKLRCRVVRGDSVTCAACGEASPASSIDVDHVVPISKGGADALNNVHAICRRCHVEKTASDGFHGAALALAGGLKP